GAEHRQRHPRLVEETLASQGLADVALMIYTSGSTGKPKGAMLTYGNLRAPAPAITERLGLDSRPTRLSNRPRCHVAEQITPLVAPVCLGSQVKFGESGRPGQEDLREVAPSTFLGVPRSWE